MNSCAGNGGCVTILEMSAPSPRKVSLIGLGYVGLPVAVAFGKKARTVGFDINSARLTELREGRDHTREVSPEDLKLADILYTDKIEDLRQADFHRRRGADARGRRPTARPDARMRASETVGKALTKGDIVVYESTVYPGVTEEVLRARPRASTRA